MSTPNQPASRWETAPRNHLKSCYSTLNVTHHLLSPWTFPASIFDFVTRFSVQMPDIHFAGKGHPHSPALELGLTEHFTLSWDIECSRNLLLRWLCSGVCSRLTLRALGEPEGIPGTDVTEAQVPREMDSARRSPKGHCAIAAPHPTWSPLFCDRLSPLPDSC